MPTLPPLPEVMWTDPTEIALSPFGVEINPPDSVGVPYAPLTDQVGGNRGIGIYVANDGRIRGSYSKSCYTGARLGSSDSRITDTDSFNHRDACLWIAKDAGNCSSAINHFYGSRVAIYNEGGEGYQDTSSKVEDSFLGALCDAESSFVGTRFKQNLIRCAVLRGGNCTMDACKVRVQRNTNEWNTFDVPGLPSFSGTAGIEVVGDGARIRNCDVTLDTYCHKANTPSGKPSMGVLIGASDFEFSGEADDNAGIDGSIAFFIAGQRDGIKIRSKHKGFHLPDQRVFAAKEKCRFDVLIELEVRKPIGQYVHWPPGCSGRFQYVDLRNGDLHSLPVGRAA